MAKSPPTSLHRNKKQLKSTPKSIAKNSFLVEEKLNDSRLQHQLDVSTMYLNGFWNLMQLNICSINKSFQLTQYNKFFKKWIKQVCQKTPSLKQVFFDLLPETEVKKFKSLFLQALKGEYAQTELELKNFRGEKHWAFLRLCPLIEPSGKIVGVLLTSRDITEEKHIAEERESNKELYLTLARHIPESNMFLIDKKLKFLIAEGTEMRKAGINPEQLSGKYVKEAVGAKFYKAIHPLFKSVFQGETAKTEIQIGELYYMVELVPVRNDEKKIYAVMGLMSNVTERKLIEKQINESLIEKERALKELADANEVKSKLLSELRTQTEYLEKQTREDALTGLYNRRYLNIQLEQEFKRAKRYGNPLSVVMCDIDHFKKINDTFSHQVGDEVLKTLGRIFKAYSRSVDTVARFGGEEFVIVLPETTKDKAVVLCEKLRSAVFHYTWAEIHPSLEVTISFGVSDNVKLSNFEKMLGEADEKLYQAKNAGRNQVGY